MGKRIKKALKRFMLILLAAFVLGIGFVYWEVSANNVKHSSNLVKVKTANSNGKKALLVYEPGRTNYCKNIADKVAKGISEDGYEVDINYPGTFLSTNLKEYSIVVFGSAVYMGSYSKVLGDYIKSIENFGDAKIEIYAAGGLEEAPELDEMAKLFKSNPVSEKMKFCNKDKNVEDKAYEFGMKLAN